MKRIRQITAAPGIKTGLAGLSAAADMVPRGSSFVLCKKDRRGSDRAIAQAWYILCSAVIAYPCAEHKNIDFSGTTGTHKQESGAT